MLRLTPWQHRPRALRRTAGVLAGMLATAGLLVGLAAPASADNDAESVSPGSGSTLTRLPGSVRIVFERPLLGPVEVSVRGPGGNATAGGARVMGNVVTQPLKSQLANGDYRISWEATSILDDSDGSTGFTLARKASRAAVKPSATPRASATPTPSPTPRATPTPRPTPKRSATAAAARASTASPSTQVEAVAAPEVEGVGYTGGDRLPSPVVLWGLLLVLAVAGFVVRKQLEARRAAAAAAPRFVQPLPPKARSPRRDQRDGGPATGAVATRTGPVTRPVGRVDRTAPAEVDEDAGPRLL